MNIALEMVRYYDTYYYEQKRHCLELHRNIYVDGGKLPTFATIDLFLD